MPAFPRMLLIGAIALVAFDAVASITSRMLDFSYTNASFGSYVIYAAIGFFVGRQFGIGRAALAGVVLGLVDASLGWAVSTVLKANAPPIVELTVGVWVVVAITVSITSAICSSIGGAIGRAIRKSPAPAA